jgi:hypothetical protein
LLTPTVSFIDGIDNLQYCLPDVSLREPIFPGGSLVLRSCGESEKLLYGFLDNLQRLVELRV